MKHARNMSLKKSHGKLNSVLSVDSEEWDGVGEREAWEGGDICKRKVQAVAKELDTT